MGMRMAMRAMVMMRARKRVPTRKIPTTSTNPRRRLTTMENPAPNPDRMNSLLIAMARAARHAPTLEKMRLGVPSGLYPTYFDVWYIAKGVYSHQKEEPVDHAKVVWQVGGWRPGGEVERHWRDVMSSDGAMLYDVS